MKWIGQHIWDFITRFRSDVYLEAVESGTIASGGNLGLDANNKIVKESDAGITDLHGAGVNGSGNEVLTDNGDGTITSESTFTYNNGIVNVTSSAGPSMSLYNTATTETANAIINFIRSDTSGADGHELGDINWAGYDEGGGLHTFANIHSEIKDATPTEEAGILELGVAQNGSVVTGLTLTGDTDTSGEVDVTVGAGVTSVTTVSGNLTTSGEDVVFQCSASGHPVVEIRNTANDSSSPTLKLNNARSHDGAHSDFAGIISFNAMDDGTPSTQEYGQIHVRAHDATSTEESGAMNFYVAAHNGSLVLGQVLQGGSTTGEVDATIGAGSASVTTISGTLNMGSTAAMTNAGQLSVAAQPNITTLTGVFTGANNNIITDNGNGTVTSESTLTYSSSGGGDSTITMGVDNDGDGTIERLAHSDGDGGKLEIKAGSATNGQTDKAGGDLDLYGGRGTGGMNSGNINFWGHKRGNTGDTLHSANNIARFSSGTTSTDFQIFEDAGASQADYLRIQVKEHGETDIETFDSAAKAAHLNINADGDLNLTSITSKYNQIYDFDGATDTFENNYSSDQGSGVILKYSPDSDQTLDGSTLHFLESDGTWALTDADQVSTGASQLLGVGLGASARTTGVLLKGFVRIDSDEILNVPGEVDGLPVYVSSTESGHFDFNAPSGSGDFVRIVGYAIDDHGGDVLIYFDPDKTWIERA